MKAIDTNILVRLIVRDDPARAESAEALVRREAPLFINRLVIAEFAWVLRSTYRYQPNAILRAIDLLLNGEEFVIEDEGVISEAVEAAMTSGCDLADLVIALTNRRQGHATTLTFDRKAAARIDAFELIG